MPGRIEFLGKHTDYAGGSSLLCAVERGFTFSASPRADDRVSITDERTGERAECELRGHIPVKPGHWSNYPLTVCRRVVDDFPGHHCGADISFESNLPSAAGLSSSSALIVGTFLVLAHVNSLETPSAQQVAEYLGAVESGVGTHGGSEDHTAMLCAVPNALVQYAFAPVRHERTVPLPEDLVFVVAVSGVAAAKAGRAMPQYNEAARRAAAALDAWRRATGGVAPSLGAALASRVNAIDEFRELLRNNDFLLGRVEQFHAEQEIVRETGDALLRGDLGRVGALVDRSQASAERWLGNQIPETIVLAREAREIGAIAASAFGAGFGGSVYALVRSSEADEFTRRWRELYLVAFPMRAKGAMFFTTRAGRGATDDGRRRITGVDMS